MPAPTGTLFDWGGDSTYVREPPFFIDFAADPAALADIVGARALALLGDSITTDHISPAGAISRDSPAGKYLLEQGVPPAEFNSFGSRRGNHEVMMRGTFGNIRLRNVMVAGSRRAVDPARSQWRQNEHLRRRDALPAGGHAAGRHRRARVWLGKLARLGGQGLGAAGHQGDHRRELRAHPPQQPGVHGRAAVAVRGWRIGDSRWAWTAARPSASPASPPAFSPRQLATVSATRADGSLTWTSTRPCRIDAPAEVEYFRHGGILQMVLRQLLPT